MEQSSISKTIQDAIQDEQSNIEYHIKRLEAAIIRKKALEASISKVDNATTATEIKDSLDSFIKEAALLEVNL